MLSYVLTFTRAHQLKFVGHSMGTTALFAMLSAKPELNQVIAKAVTLAPVTSLQNVSGLPKYFLPHAHTLIKLVNRLSIYETIFPRRLNGYNGVSSLIMYALGYHNPDLGRLSEVMAFSPASTSTKTIEQFVYCYFSKSFQSLNSNAYNLSKVSNSPEKGIVTNLVVLLGFLSSDSLVF